MYTLHIANKNYSSWSLRPWLLMRMLDIPFEEVLHIFGEPGDWAEYRETNPSGLVPALVHARELVWDSLAIVEYLAEHHAGVWPRETQVRSWARCAAAEMHAGFAELRAVCSMNCGIRVALKQVSPGLNRDLARLDELWQDGLARFGGPFLAGDAFTAVDAFYAPVAFRVQTFNLAVTPASDAYVRRLLELAPMQDWYRQALEEPYRDEPHDAEIAAVGDITEDLRTPT